MNNDISESNYNNYAADHNSIRRKSAQGLYTLARLSGCVWVVIYVKYTT